jgi:UV excision repair protein RAD23
MGNPDLAYEFLLTGIPQTSTPMRTAASPAAASPAGAVSIDALRRHPQFNMLKQLVQQNPGALSQVLDLIGQQSPELLAAIHANNDAFIAMMNEPIVDTPPPAPTPAAAAPAPAGGNPLGNPAAMMQMLASMPAPQRAQFAAQLGMSPEQMDGMMQMMAQMPPGQMEQLLGQAGMGGGMGGMGGADPPGVIRLTEDEMAAVNRLMALGFSQQQAAQAYLACDKNETLAANLLFEGGWGDDEGEMGGYHDHDEDDMYH